MSATTKDNYDQLVDDAWHHMEQALVALGKINDILYPDGEPGQFRCPRKDVELLEASLRAMSREHATMKKSSGCPQRRTGHPRFS